MTASTTAVWRLMKLAALIIHSVPLCAVTESYIIYQASFLLLKQQSCGSDKK